jgi:general secretion pathway protein J
LSSSKSAAFYFRRWLIVNRPGKDISGFTLLELMISLTIIGLILVLVFGSLRIGARAWEKGEKDVEIHQRQRVVLDNLKHQIASICLREIQRDETEDKSEQKVFFRGDSEGMAFVSRIPMAPVTQSGMVYARYLVREDDSGEKWRLLLFEKDVVLVDTEEDPTEPDEAEFFELIPAAEAIEFAYLKGPKDTDGDAEWQDTWDPDSDKGIPLAVKITLQEKADAVPICVIARIQAQADE